MSVNDNGVALNTIVSPSVTDEGLKSTACTRFPLLTYISLAGRVKPADGMERFYNVGGRALICEKKKGDVWSLIILHGDLSCRYRIKDVV